jgi:hypothetical protein
VPYAYVWWIKGATHLDIMGERFKDEVALGINTFCTAHGLDKPQI